ncbi:MAG: antA/AntB antirepressor family protein [Verrucomicrobiota bacterium]
MELPSTAAEIDDQTLRQLIPLLLDNPQEPRVDARTLHKAMLSGQKFADWISSRIAEAALVLDEDYGCFVNLGSKECGVESSGRGGHNAKDYWLALDAARHVAMLERNDRGKCIRDYFIRCAKELQRRPAPVLDLNDPKVLRNVLRQQLDELDAVGQLLTQVTAAKIEQKEAGNVPAMATSTRRPCAPSTVS